MSDQASSLTGFLARLGCTRIGSPGIFGKQTRSAMCRPANVQVTPERSWGSYPVSATARFGAAWRDESETPAVGPWVTNLPSWDGVERVAGMWQ